MNLRPAQDELAQLAEFQRRHRVSLLCVVCLELAGVAKLKQQLGDAGAVRLLRQHEQVLRDLLAGFPGGLEVSSGNGAFFLVFEKPSDAVKFVLELQGRVGLLGKKLGQTLQERAGVHVGEVLVEVPEGAARMQGLNGIHVDICQAVLSVAGPGQVLLTRFAHDSARQALRLPSGSGTAELAWANHGSYHIEGTDDAVEICEVADRSRMPLRPPKGNERVKRAAGEPDLTELAPDVSETTFFQRIKIAQRNERAAGWKGAALVALLGVLLLLSGLGDAWSYDLSFLFRRAQVPEEVVIVGMDDRSHRDLSPDPRVLWDRRRHAQLVERLTKAGARAVGFDVLFDSPSVSEMEQPGFAESPTDRVFRQALETNGRVVVGAKLKSDGVSAPSPLFRLGDRWGVAEIASGSSTIRQPVRGFQEVLPFVEVLAQTALAKAFSRPPEAWLNYYGPPGTIRTYSYLSAISASEIPDSVFTNRVVFIGETATLPPARDDFSSPYSRWREARINGVEVMATSYLNLIHNDWLHRLPLWAEACAVLLFGIGFGYVLVFFEPPRAVGIGLATALALAIGLTAQVWFTKIWFPWLVLSAVQVPAAVVWAVVVRTRLLSEEDRKLRKVLAARKHSPASRAEAAGEPVPDGTRVMGTEEHAQAAVAAAKRSKVPPVPDHTMIRCIGKGAYGEVWLAEDIIGKFKAVKIIRRAAFTDQAPFEREFRGLQKFTPISRSHPGLVHILHIGRNDVDGFIYYIMEAGDDAAAGQTIAPDSYVPRSLGTDLERHGPTPLEQVVQYGIEIAEALAHLHRHQLIHRDIKPANIIFVNGRPKLADIGLVTDIVAPGQEITYIGTQGYMPPEGHGTASADVFSLGKLLYVAVSARSVQSFPDVPDAVMNSPRGEQVGEFLGLLLRACEPVQSGRYQDAEEFLIDLRELQTRLATL